ncbi:MAG: Iron-sulfur clusters incorporation protein [Pleopsidium flavum]|nr:MAG: Iron-sulfur clusters incorporation protein [Pleopsidium flavum]
MGGIDFRKGCYVGQELTIRTHHTGVVRKRILPVKIYPAAANEESQPPDKLEYDPDAEVVLPPPGTNISRVGARGRNAGKWVSGVGNVGLSLCRLEIMTDVVVTGEGSQWNAGQEFKIAWDAGEGKVEGGEVRVKAFVPSWHRNRVGARDLHRERNA